MKAELDAARPPPSPVELVTAIPAGTRWQVELVTAESSVLGRAVFWRRADALKAASAAAIAAMGRAAALAALRRENLEHLAFVIYRTPEIMRLSIDPDEHLVQVPAPLRKRPMMNASFSDLSGEHRTEPVPPEPYCLVAARRIPVLRKRKTCVTINFKHGE